MIIENERLFKQWLEFRLEPICDADPHALAKYVLALAKKDKPTEELKTLCLDQLDVFLQQETKSFVDDLFACLEGKSYLEFDLEKERKAKASKIKTKQEAIENAAENDNLDDDGVLSDGQEDSNDDEATPEDQNEKDQNEDENKENRDQKDSSPRRLPKKERRESPERSRSPPRSRSHRDRERHADYRREEKDSYRGSENRDRYLKEREERRRFRQEELARKKAGKGGVSDERERELLKERAELREKQRRKEKLQAEFEKREQEKFREQIAEDAERIRLRRLERDSERRERKRSRSPASKKSKKHKNLDKDSPKVKKPKKACPDFYEKGICTKGDICDFEHAGAIVTIDNDRALNGGKNLGEKKNQLIVPGNNGSLSLANLPQPISNLSGQGYDPAVPGLGGLPPAPVPPPTDLGNLPAGLNANQLQQTLANLANAAAAQSLENQRKTHVPFGGSKSLHDANKSAGYDPLKIHVSAIPETLNNITKLNEHFSKFGPITNIQVQIEKGTAAIEYMDANSCQSAISSADPVLNNRFITVKAFYNKPFMATNGAYNPRGGYRGGIRGRGGIGPRGRGGMMQNPTAVHDRLGTNPKTGEKPARPENTNAENNKDKTAPTKVETEEERKIKEATMERIKKAKEAIKDKEATQVQNAKRAKVSLLQQQRELLEKQIAQQKILVEKLQNPDTSVGEKPSLLQTLKTLASGTDDMRSRVKVLESEIYEDEKRNRIEKEIKETEKILMVASTTGKDTQELRMKLYKLQDEATKLGIYARKRQAKAAAARGGGAIRGRGGYRGRGGRGGRGGAFALSQKMAARSNEFMAAGAIVDRRPRKLRVSNFSESEIDDVIVHLSEIGEIETLEIAEDNFTITLQYKTRADAELASTKGQIFRGKKLIVVWVRENQPENSEKPLDPESEARALDDELLASRLGQTNVDHIDLETEQSPNDLDSSNEKIDSKKENEDLLSTEQEKMEEDTLDSIGVELATDVPKSEANSRTSRNLSKNNEEDDGLLYEDDQPKDQVIEDEDALLDEEL